MSGGVDGWGGASEKFCTESELTNSPAEFESLEECLRVLFFPAGPFFFDRLLAGGD